MQTVQELILYDLCINVFDVLDLLIYLLYVYIGQMFQPGATFLNKPKNLICLNFVGSILSLSWPGQTPKIIYYS